MSTRSRFDFAWGPEAALTAGMLAAAALTLAAGHGQVFRGDEWAWLTSALHVTPDSILQDYNGHLLAVTEGLFWALPTLVGIGHYWVFRILALLVHLVVALLVCLLARRRIGPWPAVGLALAIAFLGTGSDVFLSAINIGIVVAIAACLGSLLALGRGDRGHDLTASLLLALGLASFSVAVAFAAGMLVELLLGRQWRRLWVVVAPGVFYVVWRIHWGSKIATSGAHAPGVGHVLSDALRAMTGSASGLVGIQLSSPTLRSNLPWLATVATVATLVAAVAIVARCLRRDSASKRLINLVVVAIVLWLLLSVGRGSMGDLDASRYVYQGAVVILLLLTELVPTGSHVRPRTARALSGFLALTIALNVLWLLVWAHFLRGQAATVKVQLASLELARPHAAADFVPSAGFPLRALTAGHYFQMRSTFGGSPADSARQLREASASNRAAADRVLIGALSLHLVATSSSPVEGPTLRTVGAIVGRVTTTHGCLTAAPPSGAASNVSIALGRGTHPRFQLHRNGLLAISARHFGDQFIPVQGLAAKRRPLEMDLPAASGVASWQLNVRASAPVSICELP